LFPAIPVSKILEYIQDCYGITFESVFLSSLTFTKLYLYLKNKETFTVQTTPLLIDFTSKDSTIRFESFFGDFLGTRATSFTEMNLTTNTLNTSPVYENPLTPPWTGAGLINIKQRIIYLKITPTSGTIYKVDVFNNGLLYASFPNLSGTQDLLIYKNFFGITSGSDNATYGFTFKVQSETPITFTSELTYSIYLRDTGISGNPLDPTGGTNSQYLIYKANGTSQTTISDIEIKNFLPDITVEQFFTGLIKMFNLVVYPISETVFGLKPLEQYYEEGEIIDISDLVNKENTDITKPKLFKKIDFKHEKSINVLNNAFFTLNNLEYGNLFFDNTNSTYSEAYEIKTPFEDVMYERTTGTNFLTASFLDKDLKPYVPKPVLMYNNGLEAVSPNIKITDGSTTNSMANYLRFNNEVFLAGSATSYYQTLNFGAEISSWNLVTAMDGLYSKFYSAYIENLYSLKTRVINIKTILTPFLLTRIKLNTRLVIQNKRYIINTMTPELNSRETTLELDNTAQEIELQIYIRGYDRWVTKVAVGYLFGTYPASGNKYKDDLVTVSVPANATGIARQDYVLIEFYKGSTIMDVKSIMIAQNA